MNTMEERMVEQKIHKKGKLDVMHSKKERKRVKPENTFLADSGVQKLL